MHCSTEHSLIIENLSKEKDKTFIHYFPLERSLKNVDGKIKPNMLAPNSGDTCTTCGYGYLHTDVVLLKERVRKAADKKAEMHSE